MRRIPNIESDTPIVPQAIAEAVWEEAAVWLKASLPRRWVGELIAHANAVYARNPQFRRQLRAGGDTGRDWLWTFMRHWLAALIHRHRPRLHTRVPQSFNNGSPLPRTPVKLARLARSHPRMTARTRTRSRARACVNDQSVWAAAHYHPVGRFSPFP